MTFTRVPNGSVLCAAVWSSGRNGWPLAVRALELYWVAIIAPLGQVLCFEAASTVLPNQVETSNRGMESMSLMNMIYPPVAALLATDVS